MADHRTAPFVRPYERRDLDGVRDVCFTTGFMGGPVAEQFADRSGFAHLFCDWHVEHRPETCWVVDDGAGGVLGYLLGSPDGEDSTKAAHDRRLLWRHLIGRGLLVRPGTARWFARAAGDLAADRRALHLPVDTAAFPANLHIDLVPAVRGRGIGGELMRTYLDRLAELGVPGVHLGAFGENSSGIAFFAAMGFEPVGEPVTNPGFRMPDGSRCSLRWFSRPVP